MIADVLRWVAGGFMAPQATVRRLVEGGHGYDVAAQLFVLGILVEGIALVAIGTGPGQPTGISMLVSGLIGSLLQFGAIVFVVFRVGRLFGGTGSLQDVVLGVAWWSVMGALLMPLLLFFWLEMLPFIAHVAEGRDPAGLPPPSSASLFGALFAMLSIVWLLANAIAAVHGFRNILGVLGAVLGVGFILVMILSLITGGGA